MAIDTSKLQATLHRFVNGTHDVEGAALITLDGLPIVSVLPNDMDEDQVAAMTAALMSLAERIGLELIRGPMGKIDLAGENGYCMVSGCGEDVLLLVLAAPTGKQGVLNLELKRAVSELKPLLES